MRRRKSLPSRVESEEEEEEHEVAEPPKRAKTTTYTGAVAEQGLVAVARLLGTDIDAEAQAALALLRQRIMQADTEAGNCFSRLPVEVINLFLQYTDYATFFNWARTCKAMWTIYRNASIMRQHFRAQGLVLPNNATPSQMAAEAVQRGLRPSSASQTMKKVKADARGMLQFVWVGPNRRVYGLSSANTFYRNAEIILEDMTNNYRHSATDVYPDFYEVRINVNDLADDKLFCCEPGYGADGKMIRLQAVGYADARTPPSSDTNIGFFDVDIPAVRQQQGQNSIQPRRVARNSHKVSDFIMHPHGPGAPCYAKGFALCAFDGGHGLMDVGKRWMWPSAHGVEIRRMKQSGHNYIRASYTWKFGSPNLVFNASYLHQPAVFPREIAGCSPHAPLAWFLCNNQVCVSLEHPPADAEGRTLTVRLPAAAQGAALTNIGCNSTTLFVVVRKRQADGKVAGRLCMLIARRVDTPYSTWWCACPTFDMGPKGYIFVTDYGVALGKDKVLIF